MECFKISTKKAITLHRSSPRRSLIHYFCLAKFRSFQYHLWWYIGSLSALQNSSSDPAKQCQLLAWYFCLNAPLSAETQHSQIWTPCLSIQTFLALHALHFYGQQLSPACQTGLLSASSLDFSLNCTLHIHSIAKSCYFFLYNIIRVRPYLSIGSAKSTGPCCSNLPSWLPQSPPSWSSIVTLRPPLSTSLATWCHVPLLAATAPLHPAQTPQSHAGACSN